jgi:hypothetical protein
MLHLAEPRRLEYINIYELHIAFGVNVMENKLPFVKFEVSTAVTMKNSVFWDVTRCGSCKNRSFGGT